jgi:restriction endonuclease
MVNVSIQDLQDLDPFEFERLVGRMFEGLGYSVTVTKRSGDEGIDLELIRGTERSIAQCKRYRGTVGQPAIRDFYGVLVHEKAVRGYFVTTGQFSLAASTWAQGKQIALTDGVDLLSALENTGLSPEPRETALPKKVTGLRLDEIVVSAMANPEQQGRILLDGTPPGDHSYRQVADFIEFHFTGRTDYVTGPSLRGSMHRGYTNIRHWRGSDASIRFVDEFDDLSRSAMESILEWQRDGIPKWKDRGTDGLDNPSLHSFVLIATVWEKRLPTAVRVRFATAIPVATLDWTAIQGSGKRAPESTDRLRAEWKSITES